jgi:hypothetical protein
LETATLTSADAAAWLGATEYDLLTLVDADIVDPPARVDDEPSNVVRDDVSTRLGESSGKVEGCWVGFGELAPPLTS